QTDAEAQGAADGSRAFPHVGDALAHHRDRLSPEEVDVGLLGADLLRGLGCTAEVERWGGLLIRLREDVPLLDAIEPPFVVPRFRLDPGLADDLHELLRAVVALVVFGE